MKGALAAMMATMAGFALAGGTADGKYKPVLRGDLYFSALIDEEETGRGAEYLARNGPFMDGVVVGEPTSMEICLGQKGLEWIRIRVFGKKVHGGNMEEGINAIGMAGRLINYLEDVYAPMLTRRIHPRLGHATVNIGTIRGGDQPSTVPDNCEIKIDRRYIPTEDGDQVYREINAILEELSERYPGFSAVAESVFEGLPPMLPHAPFCLPEDNSLAQCAVSAIEAMGTRQPKTGVFPAWTDAGTIYNYTDSDCIILGPGDLRLAHSAQESIAVTELREAIAVYTGLAERYCGRTDADDRLIGDDRNKLRGNDESEQNGDRE
jgi:acetylornithine deacetylase/succinyl-diaminopimelate desuccinylase